MSSMFGGGGGETSPVQLGGPGPEMQVAPGGGFQPAGASGGQSNFNWSKFGQGLNNFANLQQEAPRFAPMSAMNPGAAAPAGAPSGASGGGGVISMADIVRRAPRYKSEREE